ncbi:MAG: gliding motility-associated C-terminal domain-containing protein [Saprospiraceae bacterium]|nr:gliding motility-associated C-terminal domain-containing protein [Saprospiraceae bacterium]
MRTFFLKIFVCFFLFELITQSLPAQGGCCCKDTLQELNFQGLDFEFSPDPPPAWFINYPAGPMGPWNITAGSVDHVDKDHYFCSSCGNPNGPSNFIDLFGSPSGPGYGVGTMSYPLTGLTPGNQYTIEFYYAKFDKPGNYTANLKIGNWLNVNWTATNPGQIIWLKASYVFTATSSSANMDFTDTGNNTINGSQIGMLIDDIRIFEKCIEDKEKPKVNKPPIDITVACEQLIPNIPTLDITDNCDPNPMVTLIETIEEMDPCTKKITRDWEITDGCGNFTTVVQIIDVIDIPPKFIKLPENITIDCNLDIPKAFNNWIRNNGNAIASDDCTINWNANYSNPPIKNCESVTVEFVAKDFCGNESSAIAKFTVIDTTAPKFIIKAETKNFACIPNTQDSLRAWLKTFGFSKTNSDCSNVTLSTNFNGDSTKNPLHLTFYAEDDCGNIDSCQASFSHRSNTDTLRLTNYSCTILQNSIDTFSYSIHGCDSIVILEKIKRFTDSTYIQINTCDPQNKKYDTLYLKNSNGCDSLLFFEFTLRSDTITNLQKSDCNYLAYSKDTLFLKGQYCDSLVITEYIPLRKDSNFVIVNTCDLTKVDTSLMYLKNNLGCDSIITIFTIYSPQQITFIESKICGLLISYIDTIKFTNGFCDSLVITSYIPLKLDTTYIQSTSCDKSKVGIFSSIYSNQFGCDSLVTKEIILNPSDSIFISKTTCQLSQSGINIQALKNKFGCDSIVQITTNFLPSDTFLVLQNTCISSLVGKDTLVFKGSTCDSVILRTTIFIPPDTTQLIQSSCDLTAVGIKTRILNGRQCDSVIITTTIYSPSDTIQIKLNTCDPTKAKLDTILLTNAKGCDSLILFNTSFTPLSLNYELDSISCFNQNDGIFRILNHSDFIEPFEIIVNGKKLGNQIQIENLSSGSYEIFIRDPKACITDTIHISLVNPEELIIDLGNDLEVDKGSSINLNLQSNKNLKNIFWNPTNLSNCNNCSQINFIANQNMWVYTQVIDERNCNQTDSIFIRVKKSNKVFAPNSFSPNGDNINDYFYLQGDDHLIVETLSIFNRWGVKVFDAQNIPMNVQTSGWNGTFKTQKMNPGVFVYYAKIRSNDSEIIELKGNLTLIR